MMTALFCGVEQLRIVLQPVERVDGAALVEGVPGAPVLPGGGGRRRRRPEQEHGQRRSRPAHQHPGDGVAQPPGAPLQASRQDQHAGRQHQEDQGRHQHPGNVVHGEAEAQQQQHQRHAGYGLPQAEGHERGHAGQAVDDGGHEQPQLVRAGEVEREELGRVLVGAGGEGADVEVVDARSPRGRPPPAAARCGTSCTPRWAAAPGTTPQALRCTSPAAPSTPPMMTARMRSADMEGCERPVEGQRRGDASCPGRRRGRGSAGGSSSAAAGFGARRGRGRRRAIAGQAAAPGRRRCRRRVTHRSSPAARGAAAADAGFQRSSSPGIQRGCARPRLRRGAPPLRPVSGRRRPRARPLRGAAGTAAARSPRRTRSPARRRSSGCTPSSRRLTSARAICASRVMPTRVSDWERSGEVRSASSRRSTRASGSGGVGPGLRQGLEQDAPSPAVRRSAGPGGARSRGR